MRKQKPLETIFVDLDGVLVDFAGAALEVHKRTDILDTLDPEARNLGLSWVLGMGWRQFWAPILLLGAKWWEELPIFPKAKMFLEDLSFFCPDVLLLSDPDACYYPAETDQMCEEWDQCILGKQRWVRKHLKAPSRYIFTSHKYLLAGPGRILIDDSQHHCRLWEANGGKAFWFRPAWCRGVDWMEEAAKILLELACLAEENKGKERE